MAAEESPAQGRLSSFISRATDKLPPVSSLPHLARQQGVKLDPRQHQETLQLQLLIKSLSGVAHDQTSLARQQQQYSKDLFLWSKDDRGDDIVDICDRLAYLAFKSGEVEQAAAKKMEESRIVLKDIRNFENDLVPRRRNQHNLATRIATLQKEVAAATSKKSDRKYEDQIVKLQAELQAVAAENLTFETSFSVLKRTKLHEAFSLQFEAQKELGEKLALIGGYGELLLQGMETDGTGPDYSGKERTARVKAELEEALKNWSPSPMPQLNAHDDGSSSALLDRSDTRSFGDTHASVLGDDTRSETSAAIAHATVARSHPHLAHPPPLATLTSEAEFDFAAVREEKAAAPPPPLPPHPTTATTTSTSNLSIPPPLPARNLSPTSPTFGGIGGGGSGRPGSPGQGINLSPTPRPQSSSSQLGSPPNLRAHPVPPEYGTDSAPRDPTVAETGDPKIGTGGPATGVLRSRRPSAASPPTATSPATTSPLPQQQQSMPGTFDEAGWNANSAPQEGTNSATTQETAQTEGERLPQYGEGDDEIARARARAEAILAEERSRKAAA
ncbi:hypothetical protein RHOSPDRAFT_35637 [Rhodotorula sp. JG-1b]|nr:hypothetical protein RHOSPDRAFT_35637 [Rhodotorula sp. JG-1b]